MTFRVFDQSESCIVVDLGRSGWRSFGENGSVNFEVFTLYYFGFMDNVSDVENATA